MPKTLAGKHAQDFDGQVVEPGQPIPDEADKDLVKRLEEQGRVRQTKSRSSSSRPQNEGESS